MGYDRIFALIIPKYSNSGERISSDKLADYALQASNEFGGVTVLPSVLGCWINPTENKLQCEENIRLEVVVDSSEMTEAELNKKRAFIIDLAKKIGKELGQASVLAYEDIIDRVEFVKGEFKERIPQSIKERDFFKKLLD